MLINLEMIKEYLGIPPEDTTHDLYLTMQIAAAQAMIDRYCGREFELATVEQKIFNPRPTLNLTRFPLVEVVSIRDQNQTINNDFYTMDELNGRLVPDQNYHPLCNFYNYLIVEYTGGYDETTAPADLQAVLLDIVASRYYNEGEDVSKPLKSEKVDGIGSATYLTSSLDGGGGFGNFPIEQYSGVLDLYRIETVLAE